jgi:hypothetical protein
MIYTERFFVDRDRGGRGEDWDWTHEQAASGAQAAVLASAMHLQIAGEVGEPYLVRWTTFAVPLSGDVSLVPPPQVAVGEVPLRRHSHIAESQSRRRQQTLARKARPFIPR